MTTHAELSAAFERAYHFTWLMPPDLRHLDTLQTILDLHKPVETFEHFFCGHDEHGWPCPTVQIVIDALTRMGAL